MTRAFDWLTREHWLIGASLMRISLGIWAVFFLALHWRVRGQLWGPDGLLPFERFMESGPVLNVFSASRSPIYFEVIYLLAVAIAVLVVIGYRPRLILPMHWLMIWSFQDRNQQLGDGGDNLMRIVLLFLLLVNTGAHFSLTAARYPRRRWPRIPVFRLGESLIRLMRPGLTVVHNFGVLLILIQLGMLYLSTGLYKAMGELWQNGTALYYILRVDEFSWPGVGELIYRNPYLVVLGTYGTVLFEVLFLPSLFNRWTRYVMIAAGVCFHVGIAMLMGLVTFGWSMLSVYPLLVTDLEYRQMVAWARRRLDLVVFYDGWCPMCTRSVHVLRILDLLSVVEYISFRDPGVVHYYGLDSERAARRIQALDRRGQVREGIDALIAVAARSPLMWPIVPILVLGRGVAGQRFYDAAAARRVILVPGSCQSDCAVSE